MAVQLFGSEPAFMAEAAKMLEASSYRGCLSEIPPAAIDINMGCPVRKITGNGEGSALMKDPALAARIVAEVVKAVSLPVTVKIRAGWDQNSVNAPEFAKALEQAGASLICVHARTREQLYTPGIDPDVIRRVKEAVSVPVIGNGDIFTAEDALNMMDQTGCHGVMVARGAQGNPWIFEEIRAAMDGVPYAPPTVRQRLEIALEHAADIVREKGERVGIAESRKHMGWYVHGVRGAAAARGRLMMANSLHEIEKILKELENEEEIF